MFKEYLQVRSRGFQLSVLLFIWAGFYLITLLLQSLLIQSIFQISSNEIAEFAQESLRRHPGFVVLSNALYSLLVFGVPAFLFAYLASPSPSHYLGLRPPQRKKQWLWITVAAIGLVPVIVTIGGLVKEIDLGEAARRLQELRENQINTYLKNADFGDLLRNLIFLALLPAFCEELFFRGIVQKFAYSYLKKASGAIFISAFVFALMHLSAYDFLPILLAGLVLAWVYQQTSCLWLNIALHFLFNGFQVLISYYAAQNEAFNQAGQQTTYLLIATLIGVLLLSVALKKIYNLRSPIPSNWSVEVSRQEAEEENF